MRPALLLFAVLSIFPWLVVGQPALEDFLGKQAANFKEIPCEKGFSACYEVFLRQAVDPKHPEKGYFNQKLYLSHHDANQPMVLFISGYEAGKNIIKDWTTHYQTNQLFVEHRYFGESKPDNIDYTTLSMENAAHDLHRIREVFGQFYAKGWIATGGSKGGLTAATYKYFYPNDVKVTLLHSTSVKDKACDSSFFDYTDSLSRHYGCLEAITHFQRSVLQNRASILPKLKARLEQENRSYHQLGLEAILERAVLEFPFSLWQNNQGCQSLFPRKESPDSLFTLLEKGIDGWFQSDPGEEIDPFAYQAYKELGYYCYRTEKLKDLLQMTTSPVASYLHPPLDVAYSNELMVKLRHWLTNQGNHIIYFNGVFDPYSRYLIHPSLMTDAVLFLLPEQNHQQANYAHLSHTQQNEVDRLVKKWLKN